MNETMKLQVESIAGIYTRWTIISLMPTAKTMTAEEIFDKTRINALNALQMEIRETGEEKVKNLILEFTEDKNLEELYIENAEAEIKRLIQEWIDGGRKPQ